MLRQKNMSDGQKCEGLVFLKANLFVFGRIVVPVILIQPNNQNLLFSTALNETKAWFRGLVAHPGRK